MRLANDNDCCTEAIEILSDIWEGTQINVHPLPLETFDKIGAFLAAKGIIDADIDPPDESNLRAEGADL